MAQGGARAESARDRPLSPWVPLLVLAAGGVFLTLHWDEIPERWVVHWGAGGTPNGWAARTLLDVYGLLLGGVALWALFEAVAAVVRARGRRTPAVQPVASATVHMLRLVSSAVAVLMAFLAVTLPLGPHVGPGAIVGLTVVLLGGAFWLGAARATRLVRRARTAEPGRDAGYRGLFYHSSQDPRLFVPKALGVGWTINYAHPLAWPVTVLLIGAPLAIVVVALLLAT